ncbi:hypothetical protein [Streptomyces cuspidosporus]|uniref:Uncharacterized protein n=1 Tax=Streptomyces cuspidosporus TaxID=66882 RepID=A0ABN3GUY5_9ACTN
MADRNRLPGETAERTPVHKPAEETVEDIDRDRRRRRAQFLRDLTEARELRDRVRPRAARAARMRQVLRMRTFRW